MKQSIFKACDIRGACPGEFDDGWGLARLSVIEPVITLRFEGKDDATLRRVIHEFLIHAPELAEGVRDALSDAH